MVSDHDLASSLGYTAMLGGALFPLLVVLFVALPGTSGDPAALPTSEVALVAVLFLLPGGVGLYLAHERVFGWASRAAAGSYLAGLSLLVVLNVLALLVDVAAVGSAVLPAAGLTVAGATALGVATARAGFMPNARAGGALLAVALPLGAALQVALAPAPDVLRSLLASGPFGAAWLLLGYDMLTMRTIVPRRTEVVRPEN